MNKPPLATTIRRINGIQQHTQNVSPSAVIKMIVHLMYVLTKKLCIKINHRETTKSWQFMKNTATPMKPRNKCIHIGVQSFLQQKSSLQIRQFRKYRSQEKSFNELPTFFQVKRYTSLKFPLLHRERRAHRLKSLDEKRAQHEIRANAPNL